MHWILWKSASLSSNSDRLTGATDPLFFLLNSISLISKNPWVKYLCISLLLPPPAYAFCSPNLTKILDPWTSVDMVLPVDQTMRDKISHLLIPMSSQRATEGKWFQMKNWTKFRNYGGCVGWDGLCGLRRNVISYLYFIYQIDHRNEVNTIGDFENKTPTHMSATHAQNRITRE